MTKLRNTHRTGIFAAVVVAALGIALSSPAQAAAACSGTLAQYTANIQQLQTYVAKAQALADQNPLYIADVEYYASVLADAQHCAKSLGSVATANR